MKVGIIGTGKMGRGFATALASKHDVIVGSRRRRPSLHDRVPGRRGRWRDLRRGCGRCRHGDPHGSLGSDGGDAAPAGELQETVVIDVSHPYRKHEREALKGSSTAEEIQERLPNARVCRGWNHVHARHRTDPEVDGIAASVLIAGDDRTAKDIVFELARDMGFHPVDVGPLKATRELERLVGVMLFVKLGPFRVLSR
jgi:predicted dinucleotide-binding enzyme